MRPFLDYLRVQPGILRGDGIRRLVDVNREVLGSMAACHFTLNMLFAMRH
jgi:hypothetical protein